MKAFSMYYPMIGKDKCWDMGISLNAKEDKPVITWFDVTPANGAVKSLCEEIKECLEKSYYEVDKNNFQGYLNQILINNTYRQPANDAYQRRKIKDKNFIDSFRRYQKRFLKTKQTQTL